MKLDITIAIALLMATGGLASSNGQAIKSKKAGDVSSTEPVKPTTAKQRPEDVRSTQQVKPSGGATVSKTSTDTKNTCSGKKGESCSKPRELCMTPRCVTMAGEILSRMNLQADPCEDFYEFACGTYSQPESMKLQVDQVSISSERTISNRRRVAALLDKQDNLQSPSTAVQKAAMFYQTCLTNTHSDEKGRRFLLNLIKELHSWPLSPHHSSGSWNSGQWSIEEALISAYSIGSEAFFEISLTPSPKDGLTRMLSLSPSGITFSDPLYFRVESSKLAFLHYFESVVTLIYGDDNALEIKQHAKTLWRFMKSLANIFPSDKELEESHVEDNIYTMNELKKKFKYLDIEQVINGFFKQMKVPPTDEVLLKTPEYFVSLNKLIARYQQNAPDVLATYIVWTTIEDMITSCGKSFKEAYSFFKLLITGDEPTFYSDWYQCVLKTEIAMPMAVALLFREKYFNIDDKVKIGQIISAVSEELHRSLQNVGWINTQPIRAKVLRKTASIIWQNSYPDEFMSNITRIDAQYQDIKVSNDPLQNHLQSLKFVTLRNLRRIGSQLHEKSVWTDYPTDTTLRILQYKILRLPKITVPMGTMMSPIYDATYPTSLLYGATGSLLGYSAIQALNMQQLLRDIESKDNDDEDEDEFHRINMTKHDKHVKASSSLDLYQQVMECFRLQYSQLSDEEHEVDGDHNLDDNIANTGGLLLAYRAYKKVLAENTRAGKVVDYSLPGVNLTPSQEFFLIYAQNYCEYIDQRYMIKYLNKYQTTNRMEVNTILQNNPDFAAAFSCPKTSPMNPSHRCDLL